MAEHDDIEHLTAALDEIKGQIGDHKKLAHFITEHADTLIGLLCELKDKRDAVSSSHASMVKQNIHRTIVEGYSEDNIHEAFSKALGKVSAYFSEDHDVSVTVLGLTDLPKGGHRATLEVTLTPIKLSLTKHVKARDKQTKRSLDREEKALLERQESYHLQHLVLEHFVHNSSNSPSIPDFLLIHIHEADILKQMVKKGFFQASHTTEHDPAHTPAPQVKSKVIVKAPKYEIDE